MIETMRGGGELEERMGNGMEYQKKSIIISYNFFLSFFFLYVDPSI